MNRFNVRSAVVMHDLIMAALAWLLAWGARFNFSFYFPDWRLSFYTLPTINNTGYYILDIWLISRYVAFCQLA